MHGLLSGLPTQEKMIHHQCWLMNKPVGVLDSRVTLDCMEMIFLDWVSLFGI